MARILLAAAVSSTVSCALTLGAVSAGLVPGAQASAQAPTVIQARGFEVVDHLGNRVAYLGEAQVAPILVLGERGEVEISARSLREETPRIRLATAAGAPLWTAP